VVTVEWLAPAVWAGLVLLAVPIAIHLFARTPVRRVVVPSLRVVTARIPRLRRRRHLRDPWLLAVRLLIVAAAVLASAAPLIITPARRAAWAGQVVRAVIVDTAATGGGTSDAVARATGTASAGALAVRVFTAGSLDSAVPGALAWLARQPPARREIVVVGDDASLSAVATHGAIPNAIGIRLSTVPIPEAPMRTWIGAASPGRPVEMRVSRVVDVSAPVRVWDAVPAVPVPVTFAAAGDALPTIEAIWAGVQAEGAFMRAPSAWQAVRVEWPGGSPTSNTAVSPLAPGDRARVWPLTVSSSAAVASSSTPSPWTPLAPGVSAARAGDTIVVRLAAMTTPGAVARALRGVLQVAAGEDVPPRTRGPADVLRRHAIERAPGDVPPDASRHAATRDGRWLWALALGGLIAETILRRRRDRPDDAPTRGAAERAA
jgi:hypothetical protein